MSTKRQQELQFRLFLCLIWNHFGSVLSKITFKIDTFKCDSMSDDILIYLKFSMHCFKFIYMYFVCVNLLEQIIQSREGSSSN